MLRGGMYSTSRTWVSPQVKESGQRQQLNFARRKTCAKSPFWYHDFNLPNHKREWEAGRARQHEQKMAQEKEEPPPQPGHIREAFAGKEFDTNHGNVLSCQTVFCPQFEKGKEQDPGIAPWPSKSEMKYEGDDRISTDVLHGRFLGIPRVESNSTVTWQQRAAIHQYLFDEFYYPMPDYVEIFMRNHRVPELEFTDEEGEEVIGKELMDLLDPKDQW